MHQIVILALMVLVVMAVVAAVLWAMARLHQKHQNLVALQQMLERRLQAAEKRVLGAELQTKEVVKAMMARGASLTGQLAQEAKQELEQLQAKSRQGGSQR
jgi:flagellar basal body-associated protein FliL